MCIDMEKNIYIYICKYRYSCSSSDTNRIFRAALEILKAALQNRYEYLRASLNRGAVAGVVVVGAAAL